MSTGDARIHESLPATAQAVVEAWQPLAQRFVDAGHRLYLVGGIVRDLLSGEGVVDPDFDFTTDATPRQVKAVIGPVVDSLWTQGERFGTIAAKLDGRVLEITTHRAEAYDPASRKPDVVFSTDLLADLSRRDFTINAMALELTAESPQLIDPFGGLTHLSQRRLLTPRAAAESFSDDPLRMMRAARFIARLGLVPDADITAAIGGLGERLAVVSTERIRDEFDKLLITTDPSEGLGFLESTGLLARFLPEVAGPQRFAAVGRLRADVALRLATLLADVEAPMLRRRLRSLKYSNEMIDRVTALVSLTTCVLTLDDGATDGDLRRLALHGSDVLRESLELAALLTETTGPSGGGRGRLASLAERLDLLAAAEDLAEIQPAVNGKEIIDRLGIEPGPMVGRALEHLLKIRLDEGPIGRDETFTRLDEWFAGLDR